MQDKPNPPGLSDHAHLARLQSLRRHRERRDRENLFVIEGVRQLIQAADASFPFDTLFVSPVLLGHGIAQQIVRRLTAVGVRKVTLTPERFRAISTAEHASGIAAVVRQRWTPLGERATASGHGWLVIDSIRSAGNLGTILRTAEAAGMSGVIFAGPRADPYDPAVVRASMGGVFHVPLTRTPPRELGYWLAANDVDLVGLSPAAPRLWTELPPTKRHAIALGDERSGLSLGLLRLCDTEIRLPMTGRADSLNVAVAAGVMVYELVRTRSVQQFHTP